LLRGAFSGKVYPLIAALLLASLLAAKAQEKPLEIGVLALGPRNLPNWQCGNGIPRLAAAEPRRETMPFYVQGLLDELEKLKYVENRPDNAGKPGRRFVVDLRMGTLPEVRGFAREFVRKQVDVIVAVATVAVRIAQEETRDRPIPILMTGVSDPVGEGFLQSLARPGGFITGVSHQQVQGSGKRVELFKEMLPRLQRMITIRMLGYSVSEKSMVEIRAAADRLKIDILDWTVTSRAELKAVLAKVRRDTADGIMILPDSLIISNIDLVLETSLEQGVPTFGLQDFMADWGAIGAYGPSTYQAGGRVARYVDKISKGAKPGDLPVEPIDPTLVVNLKAAACLGVPLPLTVLQQADRVIR
jgi:putative ABC transport system substrate-binding protein